MSDGSICLPEHNACQLLPGAFGAGCTPPTAIERATWGLVKERYVDPR